ncbi:hypothetical protein DENSPDRAFT_843108 [Dentipellis sp. KUC8613]|nr:hypothetical protein DENSPDRAFT_843108 [Dentipellis sp. KUC8613]
MHRLFNIREIVDQIIGSLYTPADFRMRPYCVDSQEARLADRTAIQYSTLIALACTSKEFLEQCLDLIWRDLDSLVPIFLLLGVPMRFFKALDDERDEDGVRNEGDFQLPGVNIAELLANADVGRASYYLRRVQKLYTDGDELTYDLVDSLSTILRSQEPRGSLFPKLSQLIWNVKIEGIEEHFDMFGSPSVTKLSVYPIEQVCSAHLHFPNLAEVEFFNFWVDMNPFNEYIALAIARLFPLRALDCSGYDIRVPAFDALSTMPALSRLCVAQFPSTVHIYTSAPGPPSRPFFPSLQELSIGTISARTCHDLLRTLDNPQALKQFCVAIPEQEWTSAGMRNLVSCLSELCSPETLSGLALMLARNNNDLHRNHGVNQLHTGASRATSEMLRPLLRFTKFTQCDITAPILDYDDAFVESIASACPNLAILRLRSLSDQQDRSRLTLRSLYSVAKHCPKLGLVALNNLVAGVGPEEDLGIGTMKRTWDNGGRMGVAIDIAGVDDVLGARAREVAVFVKDLFPEIMDFTEPRIHHFIRHGPDAADYVPIQFPHVAPALLPVPAIAN